jgi:hypothetical protein
VENNIGRVDPEVPVLDDHILPPGRPGAIPPDVYVKEVGVRDQPGVFVKREVGCVSSHRNTQMLTEGTLLEVIAKP